MTSSKRRFHPGLPGDKTLALVDIFLFVLDARVPKTSIELARPFLSKKNTVHILTKEDLADPTQTKKWVDHLSETWPAFSLNSRSGKGVSRLIRFLKEEHRKINARRRKGLLERSLRIMLFGLPNVGKSSLGNRLLGSRKAPYGSKPGLTRGSHWLRGRGFLEILDTPGVIDASKVKDERKWKLASVWSLPDTAYTQEEAVRYLFGVTNEGEDKERLIDDFCMKRGALGPNGAPDRERGYRLYLNAFRRGELGRFTLEKLEDG